VRAASGFSDQRRVQIHHRRGRTVGECGVVPQAGVGEHLQQWWVGGDAVQVQPPGVGEFGEVVVGFGVVEAGVEEHHRHLRFDAAGPVEDDERILSAGEREVPVVAGQM